MTQRALIEIRDLRVAYGKTEVLKGVDLDVQRGSFVALLGPSGCGKTTLLRTLSGFMASSSGSLLVEGRDISREPPERRGMAMVFQSYALWSHMSVAQNIGYGLRLRGLERAAINRKVSDTLAMLGLAGYEDRSVTALSGGQRQRVALGRALAVEPKILLLDEPLSNLDARIRLQMRHEIRSLQRQLGVTAILVTHDREEAMVMADQVVILERGQVAQVGTPEGVFTRPNSAYVASFMGAENIVDCLAARHDAHRIELRIPGLADVALVQPAAAEPVDGPVQVHFRSEAASLIDRGEARPNALRVPGRVAQSNYLGGSYRCEVHTACGRFYIDHSSAWPEGADIQVCVPAAALHVFQRDPARAS